MKKLYSSLAILAFSILSFNAMSQGQANVWYFGEKFGLNFNTTPPTVLTNGSNTSSSGEGEGSSTICDANGQLLLYSDGINIYRGNGTSILAVNSNYNISQNIFVPDPSNANRYYFIHPWAVNSSTNDVQGIKYSILSATSSTNGAVVSGNVTLTSSGVTQGLTVIPDNGTGTSTGYWLVSHRTGSSNFIVWHLTSGGFSAPVTYNVGFSAPASTALVSMMKTNSCFNQIAVTYFNSGRVQVLDFNNATGAITTVLYDITNFENNQTYGVEFSPNGRILYVSLNGEGSAGADCRLYQFNLTVGGANINLASSRHTLDNTGPGGGVNRFGAVQLGPDNNIYMVMHRDWGNNGGGVSYVDNADVFGASANYQRMAYTNTNGGISSWPAQGLPPVLRSFLAGKAKLGSTDVSNLTSVCLGSPITFKVDFNNSITGYNWNVDANLNTVVDYTTASPVHNYPSAGNYFVNVTVTDFCGYKYTDTSTVRVIPLVTTTGTVSCATTPVTVTLSGTGAGRNNYVWMDANRQVVGTGATLVRSYPTVTAIPAFFTIFDASTVASSVTVGPTNFGGSGEYDGAGGNTSTFSVFENIVLDAISVRKAANFTDGTVNPRPGRISVLKGGVLFATATVNIGTNSGAGTITNFNNLGLYIPAGTGYTLSITSFSAAYNPTNTPVNNSIASVSGAASPFFNYRFIRASQCQSVVTVTGLCVLPVHFADVQAVEESNDILVSWSTLSEDNNKEFIVERSLDGIEFITVAVVKGNGNSTSKKSYSILDKNAPKGNLYYRIKQLDFDGNSSFSNVVSPKRSDNTTFELFPNPFTNEINLKLSSSTISEGEVKIYNVHGATVYQKSILFNESVSIGNELAAGFYTLEIVSNGFSGVYKIIKE